MSEEEVEQIVDETVEVEESESVEDGVEVELEASEPEDWAQFEEQAAQAMGENPVADEELEVTVGEEQALVEQETSEEIDFSAEG